MPVNSLQISVLMPNDAVYEVTYYCSNRRLSPEEKKTKTQLYIQHDDCLCTLLIDKSICDNQEALENIVHNKVINTKGHLC
ncbi:MAG: hypothetical protein M3R50_06945 [Bacteroidota bacterium]|nr:hypothetical protein [Bacteroidota bacterium]